MALTTTHKVSAFLSAIALALAIGIGACPGHHGSDGSAVTLLSVAVTPTNPTIALGTTRQLRATGTYSDGSSADLTALAEWSSSNSAAGTVSTAAPGKGLASGLVMGNTTITATYAGRSGWTTLTISSAALVAIEVTPTNPRIALGTSLQFAATGRFTDGTTQDLSAQVAWDSSAEATATVSMAAATRGLAHSVAVGNATIQASFAGVNGATTLSVTNAVLVSLAVTPSDPSIALGTSQAFYATGTFSDGSTQDLTSTATWAAANPAAQVSNAAGTQGLAQSIAVGSSSISATYSGIAGSSTLTISNATLASIAITPTLPSIALGTAQSFTATGTFTDGSVQDLTSQVTWDSSAEVVASISNAAGDKGVASSVAMGTTDISAELSGVRGTVTLAVSAATLVAIDVTASHPSAALGTTLPFVATGTYSDSSTQDISAEVTWTSSDVSIATVSNADGSRGLATTVAVGTTSIGAALGSTSGTTTLIVSAAGLVAVAVSPDGAALAQGTSLAFSALGLLSDGTRQDLTGQVTWSSSNAAIATVSNAEGNRGVVIAAGVGSATLSAVFAGVSGSATIDVSAATLSSIDIVPFVESIAKGTQVRYSALGNYSDGSSQDLGTQVRWSTSDASIVSISNAAGSQGLATGVNAGTATVTAALDGVVESVDLGVTAALLESIALSPVNPSTPVGSGFTIRATGTFTDGATQDLTDLVTWSSSDGAVATISNAAGSKGFVRSVSAGVSQISAIRAGKSATTTLTVNNVTLVSVSVTPVDPLIPAGYSLSLQALGSYSDGTSRNLTAQVLWSSSNANAAKVSNSLGSEGRVTSSVAGSTTLTGTITGVSGITRLTVTSETLNSIVVTPASTTLAVGATRQLTATGYFSQGSVLDLTSQVRWQLTPRSVANIGNSTSRGLVSAKKVGSATIRASKSNKTGTASLSVSGS